MGIYESAMCCNYVFFFKQKTAYEMRISDWSSDVCSSDLIGERPRERAIVLPADDDRDRNVRRIEAAGARGDEDIAGLEWIVRDVERAHVEIAVAAARRNRRQAVEIGRAHV